MHFIQKPILRTIQEIKKHYSLEIMYLFKIDVQENITFASLNALNDVS